MKSLTLLAVDDDDLILQTLKIGLPAHWNLAAYNNVASVPPNGEYSAAMVDMHLSGNTARAEGLDAIRALKERMPYLEIVAMSGDLDRDLMENCIRAGASRYIAKPINMEEVLLILDKIEALLLMQSASFHHPDKRAVWIGNSAASQEVKRQVAFLRGEPGPILLEGESGTGKEVVAQLIHNHEPGRPFIAVNVAAIPENLFESELFGHARGSFTGADKNKIGLAEAAHGGDLFLDEIEALSLPLQAKLLRFLESGEVRRIGSKDVVRSTTRVIVASNCNLKKMVEEKNFREDLLWRLSAKKIALPPLRTRKEDIADLATWFLSLERFHKKELSIDAVQAMENYDWPGNARELKRVCEQLALTSPLPIIRREDVVRIVQPRFEGATGVAMDYSLGLDKILQNFEYTVISQALKKFNDIEEASRQLQISRSSLYKRIKDFNIEWK